MSVVVDPPFLENDMVSIVALTVVIIRCYFLAVRYYMQYLRRRYSDEKIRFFTYGT